jgi:hypothetical protein
MTSGSAVEEGGEVQFELCEEGELIKREDRLKRTRHCSFPTLRPHGRRRTLNLRECDLVYAQGWFWS